MKCKIGGQAVELEIEGRVRSGVERHAKDGQSLMGQSQTKRVALNGSVGVARNKAMPRRDGAGTDTGDCSTAGRGEAYSPEIRQSLQQRALEHPRRSGAGENPVSAPPFSFTLAGQIRGGKNNMKVGRDGRHYPDQTFAKWRDEAVREVRNHLARQPIPYFPKPLVLEIEVHYAAGDLRRRDIPAMMDSLWHVLERAQVVEDDAQIKESHWYEMPVDKANPHVTVTVKERKA